jgi:hypothetical protein
MESVTRQRWQLMAGALVCLAPVFAACPGGAPPVGKACVSLANGGNDVVDNIEVGPYYASINGGVSTAVICDDFGDESYFPETWTADVYNSPNSATTDAQKWSILNAKQPQAFTMAQDYNMVGWLASQMMLNLGDAKLVGQIDFALWAVFDPTAMPFMEQTRGTSWLTAAAKYKDDPSFISGFDIYSPDTHFAISSPGSAMNPPQELLVVHTPEPPGLTMLGLDLSGLAALIFLFHRRKRQSRG